MVLQIVSILDVALRVLVWLVIARCILSFVKHNPYNPLFKFIYDITEPIMAPFRRLLPVMGGLDLSPFLLVVAIEVLRNLIIMLATRLF